MKPEIRHLFLVGSWAAALFLVVLLGTSTHAVGSQESGRMISKPTPTDLDSVFSRWASKDGPGASVAVLLDGEVVFKNGYGQATLEYDVPIEPATIFHVASVSKQFTCFAVALLADEGKVSLDDDIRTILPEVPDFGTTITIRHLMHHVSGLRDQWELLILAGWRMDDVITKQDVLELVAAQRELNFPPGDQHLYCNTGYTLLAEIAARVSGKTFPEFTNERIFEPLGMKHTHFHDDHEHLVKNRAYSYRPSGGGYTKSVLSYAIAGATSLFTTAEDLLSWQRNFETGQVGGRAVIDAMLKRGHLNDGSTISYALGVVHGTRGGFPTISHSGGDAGFRSFLVRFPVQSLSVAVLSNAGDARPNALAMQVADLYLSHWRGGSESSDPDPNVADVQEPATGGESETGPAASSPDPEFIDVSTEVLARYAGVYRDPQTDALWNVILKRERLDVVTGGTRLRLRPIGEGRFLSVGRGESLEVVFTAVGEGSGFQLCVVRGDAERSELVSVQAADRSSEHLMGFEGDYRSEELDVSYRLFFREGRLFLRRRKYGETPLTARYGDGFDGGRINLHFTRDDHGIVDGFLARSGRVKNLRFDRVKGGAPNRD